MLKLTAQCPKCPWIKGSDPREIPNGYCESRHRELASTIARPADLADMHTTELHVMACHETEDAHCVGWLMNQLGPGNNIALRLKMRSCENASKLRLRGEQHATFKDTLPEAEQQ
jgi:hypothetical protein